MGRRRAGGSSRGRPGGDAPRPGCPSGGVFRAGRPRRSDRRASAKRERTCDRRGSGIASTRSRMRRASASASGTSWRQQAPQPARHETVRPSASTTLSVSEMRLSASAWAIGRIASTRVGPVGTVISAWSVPPGMRRAKRAVTVSGPFDGETSMGVAPEKSTRSRRSRVRRLPPDCATLPPTWIGPTRHISPPRSSRDHPRTGGGRGTVRVPGVNAWRSDRRSWESALSASMGRVG